MSFDSHLIHTCTIERPYQEQTNTHGLANDRYRSIAESQACRLVIGEQRIGASEKAERPMITTYTLLLPANADIAQKDCITAVTFEDGSVMSGGFIVEKILPRRGKTLQHISATLTRIS